MLAIVAYLFACSLPFTCVGAVGVACVFLVRNRLWWVAPLFAVANLWLSYVLVVWISAHTPRAGVGDWTPFIYGSVAGATLSLAASGAIGLLLRWNRRRAKNA